MKPSGIGGQAVIEGVMMKNKNEYAIAVRKPNNEVIVEKREYHSIKDRLTFLNWPILRGVVSFVESMVIGMKTITFSASFFEEEEEVKPGKVETAFGKVFKEKSEAVIMGITVIFSIILAIGIFMILPYFLTSLFQEHITSDWLRAVLEGVIRILIFIGYVGMISQLKDIKRVFMYHGAEHKTINCLENGQKLTVSNVRKQSREHKRCGTSFLLYVIIISIIFFAFIRVEVPWLRILLRVLLVPVIAGVAYEFIRLAGSSESKIIGILSKPGLWLQGLTTREPDDGMIEVAIGSVEAVFDWKAFLAQDGQQLEEAPAFGEPVMEEAAAEEPILKTEEKETKAQVQNSKGKKGKKSRQKHRETEKADKGENQKSLDSQLEKPKLIVIQGGQGGKDKEKEAVVELREEALEEGEKELVSIKKQEAQNEKTVTAGSPDKKRNERNFSALRESVDEEEEDEEDDEILKALDRYFVFDENEDE